MAEKSIYIYGEKLNKYFEKNFKEFYKKINVKEKTSTLGYIQHIYRKWLSSALYDETVLSPVNIMERLNKNSFSDKSVFYNIKPKSVKKMMGFDFFETEYSLENHPIVRDMKIFLDECYPETDIYGDKYVDDKKAEAIMERVSIYDREYIDFLFAVAEEMKIMTKRPAIYATVYKVKENYSEVLENKSEALKNIVNAAIKISVNKLNDMLPDSMSFFDEKKIRHMLKKEYLTHKLLIEIYSYLGIDIEEVWETDDEEADDFEQFIMSSTFIFGVMYDKWFLTPFGYYLKFIKSLYIYAYNFEEEIGYISKNAKETGMNDTRGFLYSPCTRYEVTDMGAAFFGIEKRENETDKAFLKISAEKITEVVTADKDSIDDIDFGINENSVIFRIRIRKKNEPEIWIDFNIESSMSLHELHLLIRRIFTEEKNFEYSFFIDEEMSVFGEYTSKTNKKRNSKKTNDTAVSELLEEIGDKIYYRINASEIFEIELIGTGEGSRGAKYPEAVDCSPAIKGE